AWRWCAAPSWWGLVRMCLAVAVALTTKHTAIVVPLVVVTYALLWWICRSRSVGMLLGSGLVATLLIGFFIWAVTLFDVSVPRRAIPTRDWPDSVWLRLSQRTLPAGIYLRSLAEGALHAASGHPGFLNGQLSERGWWYYFPLVATYKVAIGFFVLML